MFRTILALVAAVALTACATPAANVVVNPSSDQGLIVVDAQAAPPVTVSVGGATVVASTFLTFSHLPEQATPNSPAVLDSHWVHLRTNDDGVYGFHATPAPAGRYILEALNVGLSWGACFNQQTFVFDLHPGEVVYLGSFSAVATLAAISEGLPSRVPTGSVLYLYDRLAPDFVQPAAPEATHAALQSYLSTNYSQVHAPIRFAELTPASFQKGRPSGFVRFPRCAATQ